MIECCYNKIGVFEIFVMNIGSGITCNTYSNLVDNAEERVCSASYDTPDLLTALQTIVPEICQCA